MKTLLGISPLLLAACSREKESARDSLLVEALQAHSFRGSPAGLDNVRLLLAGSGAPSVTASVASSSNSLPLTIGFSGSATPTPAAQWWDFGNGSTVLNRGPG